MAYLNDNKILSIVKVETVGSEEVDSNVILKSPLQIGDNLRGRKVYFNTKLSYDDLLETLGWLASIYLDYHSTYNYEAAFTFISNGIEGYTSDTGLFFIDNEAGIKVKIFDATSNEWLMEKYTLPSTKDYIVKSIYFADTTIDNQSWNNVVELRDISARSVTYSNTTVEKALDNAASKGDIKALNSRLTNIETNLYEKTYNEFEDSTTAKVKNVPSNALPYAYVNSVGGRSLNVNQLQKNKGFVNEVIDNSTDFRFLVLAYNGNEWFTLNGYSDTIPINSTNVLQQGIVTLPANLQEFRFKHNGVTTDIPFGHLIGNEINPYSNHKVMYSMLFKTCDVTTIARVNIDKIMLIDLTLMYGAGNEPTDVNKVLEDLGSEYIEYNEGTITNLHVSEIKSVGRNLLNFSFKEDPNDVSIQKTDIIKSSKNTAYIMKIFGDLSKYKYMSVIRANTGVGIISLPVESYKGIMSFNTGNKDNSDFYLQITNVDGVTNSETIKTLNNSVVLSLGATVLEEYTPYKEDIITLPSVELNAFDTLDLENKKVIKATGVVNLGTYTWNIDTTENNVFYADIDDNLTATTYGTNGICEKYIVKLNTVVSDLLNKEMAISSTRNSSKNGRVFIKDTRYTDAATFKQAMSGVLLHYELATPIENDIEVVDEPFIEVEPNGTIDFGANIPSKISYLTEVE